MLNDSNIGGPLPLPQALSPTGLINANAIPGSQMLPLAPGQSIMIPRGSYLVTLAGLAMLQWLDPVLTVWRGHASARQQPMRIISDGLNYRVANLTGCPIGAIVTNGGNAAYAQATTIVTPSAGGSTWLPIIGGQVNTTATISTAGSGYAIPPLVFCPAPPAPGIPASFVCALTNGTVSSITSLNQGAGYLAAPPLTFVTNPFDPNYLAGNAIVAATGTTALVAASGTPSAGKLTGLLNVNPGAAQSSAPTLAIAGTGASAAATVVMLWTATGISISNAGATLVANNELTSVGGIPSATPAWTNPETEFTGYIPRKASMLLTINGGTVQSVASIYDGGLFTGTPNAMYLQNGVAAVTSPVLTFTLGSANAGVMLQPLG